MGTILNGTDQFGPQTKAEGGGNSYPPATFSGHSPLQLNATVGAGKRLNGHNACRGTELDL